MGIPLDIPASLQLQLDAITATRGSLLYRGASAWSALAPGTSGYLLQTGGAGADPSWVVAPTGGNGSGGDMLSTLLSSEVSVTTTATLTIGKMHVCSGTSADYTVTLPAASGNAGKFIGLRMADSLTKLVTVDGNGSETINGALARVMHNGESAILECDGAGWSKISGRTIPMACAIHHDNTVQSFSANTVSKVGLNTVDLDNTGAMANTGSNRIGVVRPGLYNATGGVQYNALAASVNTQARIHLNGSVISTLAIGNGSGSYASIQATKDAVSVGVGDYFELFIYVQDTGGNLYVSDPTNFLVLLEVPTW